jgi:hypothetical protein
MTALAITLSVLLAGALVAIGFLVREKLANNSTPAAETDETTPRIDWTQAVGTGNSRNHGVLHAIAFLPDALRVHLTGKDDLTVAALTKGTPTDDGNGMVYTIDEGVTLTVKPFDRTVELKSDHAPVAPCVASYDNGGFTVDDTDRLLGFFTRIQRTGKDIPVDPADALNRKFTPQTSTASVPLDTV